MINHSIAGPESYTMTFYSSLGTVFGSPLLAPTAVSLKKVSVLSAIPFVFYADVGVPLIPEVAFVEFPPQNGFLSIKTTLDAPAYMAEWAVERPDKPPPITITYYA